ncbi:MAG: ABC transporter permease [Oscillospiraceae bacterium]|nr:ABC transporter permease [Oscillospiraceae bacterium]
MKAKYFAYPYVLWMAVFVVAPIFLVVYYAFITRDGTFTLANFSAMGRYTSVFARSFWLSAIATVICIIIGYPISYILAKENVRVQRIMIMLIMLPMWMNFLLRTYAWMSILENTGLLNRFLRFIGLPALRIINTQTAVIIGMVYNFVPFMILPIYSVIVKIDRSVIEAAQDLGASNSKVLTKLVIPLSLPGVLSGITMVFVPGVSTFVISQLLGGGKEMLLGDLIELQFLGAAYNPHLGSSISLVMMIIVVVFMYIMNRFGEGEESVML